MRLRNILATAKETNKKNKDDEEEEEQEQEQEQEEQEGSLSVLVFMKYPFQTYSASFSGRASYGPASVAKIVIVVIKEINHSSSKNHNILNCELRMLKVGILPE